VAPLLRRGAAPPRVEDDDFDAAGHGAGFGEVGARPAAVIVLAPASRSAIAATLLGTGTGLVVGLLFGHYLWA